jgi:HEAT repeats
LKLANFLQRGQNGQRKVKAAMNARFLNWKWIVLWVAVVSLPALVSADVGAASDAEKSLEKTRLELQAQGFKTDLTNFDFSTSPELRAREAVLKQTAPNRNGPSFVDHPELMEAVGSNSAIVVWKQIALRRQTPWGPDESYDLQWADFDDAVNDNEAQLDAACAAILSGPIQFNLVASNGSSMLLPNLAMLKNLTLTLNDGAVLALHESHQGAAWTNLMAATRLVTEWNPEPVEISHRVRFANTKLVFKATWQALQAGDWPDDQLARLQHEWENAGFLTHLPEIQAFRRVCDLKTLEEDILAAETPETEAYGEEERMLLFYRDREVEYRNAVAAGTWSEMRPMPGVTNEVFFEPKIRLRGRFGVFQQARRMNMQFIGEGRTLLAQAAEAEAERRILITALAVERYYGKYKHYPETLQPLTPEFLKSAPVDFMNGQPLHYRVTQGGHFVLYSVGPDGTDNGGRIETRPSREERFGRLMNATATVALSDIVWPLVSSSAEVAALRKQQDQTAAEGKKQREAEAAAQQKAFEQEAEEARQAAMKKLLAEKPSLGKEPVYDGKPLSIWVNKIGQIERYNGTQEDAVTAIRAIGPEAVPFLLEWMPHPGAERPPDGYPDDQAIEFAWWALGTQGKSAIPILAKILSRPQRTTDDYSVWTHVAKSISYLGPDAIVPMLTVATNMHGQHEQWELLHNFENLGTNGESAIPALVHWANDPDYWVRDGVVSALGGIGKRPDLSVPVLMNALQHDSNSMVRRDAAEALGSFAKDSEAVLPELTRTLKDPDWEARGGALSGLGKIHSKPEIVVPLISPFLYDENNVIQRSAAYALRFMGSEAGYRALIQATNAPGIGDIIYQAQGEATNKSK